MAFCSLRDALPSPKNAEFPRKEHRRKQDKEHVLHSNGSGKEFVTVINARESFSSDNCSEYRLAVQPFGNHTLEYQFIQMKPCSASVHPVAPQF